MGRKCLRRRQFTYSRIICVTNTYISRLAHIERYCWTKTTAKAQQNAVTAEQSDPGYFPRMNAATTSNSNITHALLHASTLAVQLIQLPLSSLACTSHCDRHQGLRLGLARQIPPIPEHCLRHAPMVQILDRNSRTTETTIRSCVPHASLDRQSRPQTALTCATRLHCYV